MRGRNGIRETLQSGEHVVGARAANRSPMLVEVYGRLGLDFVWVDFEHGGESPQRAPELESLVRAAEVADVDLLVRLPSGEPSLIRKVLDAGVRTILVPRVETAAEVARAVRAARFTYDGEVGDRGIGTGYVNWWGETADDGYAQREDDAVLVGAMVENRSALENLDEILSVPDLGFVFVGPSDLSVSFGRPLQKEHEAVVEAIERVRNASLAADVPVGRIATGSTDARHAIDDGYQLLRIGDEIEAARRLLGDRLDEIHRDDDGER